MIVQLNPAIPVMTPKGPALAHVMIDNGIEHDLNWVCFQDKDGECWTWRNSQIRAQKNVTHGREYIAPFYNPDDVAFKDEDDDEEEDLNYEAMYYERCEELSEAKEDIYDFRKENARLHDKAKSLEELIRGLMKNDQVYPNRRGEVQQTLDKLNADEVVDGNQA